MTGDTPTAGVSAGQEEPVRPTVEDLLTEAARLNEAINKHREQLGGHSE
ncbi:MULTISPECIES: hypothetical protein [unclassified Streptomyces]|nr:MULTISPECIES: hypothetical protein [unclassified Streptomyces]MYT34387.1 hypothetical protein [Streptomyces sp. SID8354]